MKSKNEIERDAKNEFYDATYDEFQNHLDHSECQELLRDIFICLNTNRDSDGLIRSDIDKYFDVRMLVITKAERVTQYLLDNTDRWEAYLPSNPLDDIDDAD